MGFSLLLLLGIGLHWSLKNRGPAAAASSLTATPLAASSRQSLSKSEKPHREGTSGPRTLRGKYCENAHGTTCSTQWPSRDPTGRVLADAAGEVLALRQLRDLIRIHPTWSTAQIEERLAEKLYTPARKKLIQNAFDWVIKHLSEEISSRPATLLSDGEKRQLMERLARIQLEMPPPASVYADAPDLLTKNTVYYERTSSGELRLRVGGAYLINATSWYNLIFTFGHEISHSIDPCEARQAGIVPTIYQNLTQCFVSMGWVDSRHAACEKGEQVSEVFADWVATELAAKALEESGRSYSASEKTQSAINFARDLCAQTSSPDYLKSFTHQLPQVRIGSIIGQSPSVRKVLGCARPVVRGYCNWNGDKERTP